MDIIAKRGNTYIVTEEYAEDPQAKGFIIDLEQDLKSQEMRIQRALKWGYWEPVENLPQIIINKIRLLYET